ncbi:MAG: hypothetical protein IJW38_04155 [Clostridia bacterium]|nr:hypothetical protein [Clostridia bacterium]
MKIQKLNKKSRLDFFKSLYESAKLCYSDELETFERNMKQYRGSLEIDGSNEKAITVRNISYEIIESQISSEIPLPKTEPSSYSEKRERCAKSIERLLYSLRKKIDFESMNDIDERYTYIYGGSVFYLEWDNSQKDGREIGGVKIMCLSPKDFIPQPNITEVSDMEYFFLKFTTTRSELSSKYGISESDTVLAECEFETEEGYSTEYDTVALIVAFYKDEDGDVGKFVFSGDLTLEDLPKYYHRKVRICKKCGLGEVSCSCAEKSFDVVNEIYEKIEGSIYENGTTGVAFSENLQRAINEVPYYVPKSFPVVIRKNTSSDGKLFGQSDCEYIRPEQQAINKIESRILQKLLRAGVTPIVPEDANISLNNSVFGQLIKIRPGESAAQYGKVDTTPDISQDIAEAERLYDHSKRILGISDALQGLDTTTNESGYARQLKISQATGRLESKRKMKHGAYAKLDRLIFEHYLAFADEARDLVYKDSYGRIHNTEFSRYDFIEYDIEESKFYYYDSYLFSIDLNTGAEYQREALWERNFENLKAGTLGDPALPSTLLRYWQFQERAHYPFARENVEYFLGIVNESEALT